MVSHTYETLESAILNYTEDDSDEFATALPLIIKNGQERVVRELDLEIFKQTYNGTFTANTNYQNKPADALTITSLFYINGSGRQVQVLPRTYDWCIMYAAGSSGDPKFFDEAFSDTQIFVALAPSAAFAYSMRALRRPDYISPTKAENWVSKFAGDLLLYACLMESEGFLMSAQTGKIQEWAAEYDRRIVVARNELSQLARHEYSPIPSNKEPRE